MQASAKTARRGGAAQDPDLAAAAEQAVLGGLLQFEEAHDLVRAVGLTAGDFEDPVHRVIAAAISMVRMKGQPVDLVTVFEQLREHGQAKRCGGLDYLNALQAASLSASSAGAHAALVKEKARRRRWAALGLAIEQAATHDHSAAEAQARVSGLAADLMREASAADDAASPIAVEWAADLAEQIDAPPQIVENVLTAGGMSMFFGESNSGKSYLAIHLAICMSLGLPWLGRRTQRAAVLYVAAEGAWSIRLRLAAYRKHFERAVGTFGLIPQALNLLDPSVDVENLIALIEAKRAELVEPVALIVVDTVARVMGGGDENAAQDMGRLVGAGDRIRQATGAHVLYIHHAGKDASRGARGHSSLRAALDTEIEVTADEATKTHTAHITKQRDLPSKGDKLAGRFVSVELGVDQWGGAVTACAVEDAEHAGGQAKPRSMTPTQRAVMGYLAGQAAAVAKSKVRDDLVGQGINRASVYRAINDLLIAGLVMDHMGLLYAPKA